MEEKLWKYISLLEEYNSLLSDEIDSAASFATIHGWTSAEYNIKRGKELRAKMNELQNEIADFPDIKSKPLPKNWVE